MPRVLWPCNEPLAALSGELCARSEDDQLVLVLDVLQATAALLERQLERLLAAAE